MRIKNLIVLAVIPALIFGSCARSSIKNTAIKDEIDTVSYAFGIINYNYLLTDSIILDPVLVARAMMDSESGEPEMDDNSARAYLMEYINKSQILAAEKQAEQNREIYHDYMIENEAFLENNKEKEGVEVTTSGLQYEVITMGNGPKPTAENTVSVNYVGTLIDGSEFDSSDEPVQFPLASVIPGWTEALQLMPVGSKFRIYLPESLAYGSNGAGDIIKPFSTLIFDVELLEIID